MSSKSNKKRSPQSRILTVPNLLSFFRLCLIPVIIWLYCVEKNYLWAGIILILSGITDTVDGFVARRFHMTSDLGKMLDPVADKLTQGALVICFAIRYPLMRAVLVLFIVKEGFMGIMGLLLLPRGKKLDGAKWFGKVCTAVLYVLLFVLLLFPGIGAAAANGLILICAAFMLFSLIMYIPVFRRMWKESEPDTAERK